ncbi:hypothetical protein J6590_013907 [Homalodisca vitripennis]|nr:hypothetical protein J6590_013907 [Homalodisca vitripennis]
MGGGCRLIKIPRSKRVCECRTYRSSGSNQGAEVPSQLYITVTPNYVECRQAAWPEALLIQAGEPVPLLVEVREPLRAFHIPYVNEGRERYKNFNWLSCLVHRRPK